MAIVKGLVEQQTPAAIARAVGVSRKTVYEELKAPETQELIRAWLQPYHGQIQEMIPGALSILSGKIQAVGQKPQLADTLDMLRIIRSLGLVMGWAQGKPNDDGEAASPLRKFSGTMEELLIVYRTLTAGQPEAEAAEAL